MKIQTESIAAGQPQPEPLLPMESMLLAPLPELPKKGKRHRRPGSINKKIVCAVIALPCAAVLIAVLLFPKTNAQEPPLRREYLVETGNITVGVDATGSITTEKTPQFIDVELQLERYTVKKGDLVKQGDIIAELSPQDVEKKRKEAKEKLATEQFNVRKAQTDKTNFIAESEKKHTDTRFASETTYNEAQAALQGKADVLTANIEQKKAAQAQQETVIVDCDVQKAARPDVLVSLTEQIATQEAANAAIQQKIDDFTADTAANGIDHTFEIAALAEEKVRGEAALLDLNTKKQTLEKTDYDAMKTAAQAQLDTLKAELSALQIELDAANAAIAVAQNKRQTEMNKENADLEFLRKQNAAQLAVHDNTIRLAQIECDAARVTYEKYLAFSKNPQISAAYDGTVLNLGVAVGANTGGTTPIVEIGTAGAKTLTLLVDPVDIVDVTVGQAVSFYVDAYPDATFTGEVKSKSYLQNDAGKFAVTINLDGGDGTYELLEGMGASATLIVKQKKDVLTLQNKAIMLEDGKQYVLVQIGTTEEADAKSGSELTTEKREIKTGFSDGRITEILSGLQAGDVVIVEERYEEP